MSRRLIREEPKKKERIELPFIIFIVGWIIWIMAWPMIYYFGNVGMIFFVMPIPFWILSTQLK